MGAVGNVARARQHCRRPVGAGAARLARRAIHFAMSARELVLSYDESRWRARGDGVDVAHSELRGLEALIGAQLATDAASVDVRLAFDMVSLPRWLHQYHAHYCNYTLRLPPRK